MPHARNPRRGVAVALLLLPVLCTPQSIRAGEAPGEILRCRGVLHFGDALGRASTVFVDLDRAWVYTPDCKKYAHIDRYCSGTLLDIAGHSFQFGGALSQENTKFWAELYRASEILPATSAGPATEAIRVLFLGRCEPAGVRRAARVR
jgi:hypothetical protein